MLMSSNDYQRLKQLTTRYQPKALNRNRMPNEDLIGVIADLPKQKFMKTINFGSKSVGRTTTRDCMQIVDHEEIVFEETVEEEGIPDHH
jgi:hypothetical protein